MAFVQFSKTSLSFGERRILNQITINLSGGTKAALTGANGSGKSTLMKVLCGVIEADSGEKAVQKETKTAYLPQSGIMHSGCTLRQEADKAFYAGYALQNELEKIGIELENTKNSEARTKMLLETHHQIQTKLENSDWYRRDALAEQTLLGLGFLQSDLERSVQEFSGGWQMRIALAKLLLEKPDILLLDEPTNYLDLEARDWLLLWLLDFKGGFLLVSHDRFFLDHSINEVYELFNGTLKRYAGNYTHYEEVRRVELETLIARYNAQQLEIQKLEDFIRRFGAKATKAAQAQERAKMLEKMERVEIPETLKKIHFNFPKAPHAGRIVLTLENICKKYTDFEVLKNLNLTVENGERLAVVGKNGAGKSTLLRILSTVDTDFTGTIKLGSGVQIGYFSQDNTEKLTENSTIIDLLEKDAPLEMIPKLRDLLGAFLFRGDDVYKNVNVLSGGEKSRIALLRLLLKPVNVLILDEPTNHLDLHSKDVLLDALKGFGGTVLFVSHDKGFLLKLATRVLELKPAQSREFVGGYDYYLERIMREEQDLQKNPAESIKTQTAKNQQEIKTQTLLSWEEEKKRKSEKRRQEKEEERILAEIEKTEAEKSALEAELAKPQIYSDGEKSRKIQQQIEKTETHILKLHQEWEIIAQNLSKF